MRNRAKVLLVTNIPTPYRLPLFNELGRELSRRGYGFKVVFGSRGYSRRRWKHDTSDFEFAFEILSEHPSAGDDSETPLILYRGLLRQMKSYDPDLVIVAGFSIATAKVCMWSIVTRRAYLIWSGSTGDHRKGLGWLRSSLRQVLARRAIGAVAYGSLSRDYLIRLGVRPANVRIAINTVDVLFFAESVRRLRSTTHAADRKVLTFVGELSPRKNVLRLLELVRHLSRDRNDFVLEIVGDGSEMQTLKAYVDEYGLGSLVRFLGHQPYGSLPRSLSRTYCFLYQTEFDIWGLALVEAMAAGLPCVCSVNAGAGVDLIEPGQTGFLVNFEDTQEAARSVRFLLDRPSEAESIGKKASEFVLENASIEKSVEGFVDSIVSALSPREQNRT